MPETSEQRETDRWRGEISTQVAHIREGLDAMRAAMTAMRAENTLLRQIVEGLDGRVKPLERLRYIGLGMGVIVVALTPVLWRYGTQLSQLLERVDKMLSHGAVFK